MMKIALPVLLAGIVMIAGIFAFMPVDKATTVHTTIQGTQLNNIAMNIQDDLGSNATASCGASGGSFLVYWTYTNVTAFTGDVLGQEGAELSRQMVYHNGTGTSDTPLYTVTLSGLGNQTTVSGVVGGLAGETIQFFGNGTDATSDSDDTGDLTLTLVCRSTDTATIAAASLK